MGPRSSTPADAAAWLARNAVDCLPEGELERKLSLGRPLRVKLGIDPTAPDIHLGFTVVLAKLREFQDLGHTVVLIIGDYTARVGDPSGRSSTRPVLDPAQIDANARTFQEQALTVLDPEQLDVRFNGEWLDMPIADLFTLMRTATVAQILERDDFSQALRGAASRSRCWSCSIRCCRATTRLPSRPMSSSAAPIRSSTCCSGETSSAPTGNPSR